MNILAIETSCDETGVAILKVTGSHKNPDFSLLSNLVASQIEIHRPYGGVYPSLAKREHQKTLIPVLKQALKQAGLLKKKPAVEKTQISKLKTLKQILAREEILLKNLKKFLEEYQKPEIDTLAVTIGPGLEPCLWVGVNFAKALAFSWGLSVVAVNHIEAHLLANWLAPDNLSATTKKIKPREIFPAICLVVSGGHTQLVLIEGFGQYRIIGETRDDAAGECYDKTARILCLSYPGGPAISQAAAGLKTINYKLQTNLPRPMIHSKDYDFSFSGLKTAVLYAVKSQSVRRRKSERFVCQMAAEIQQAINEVLIRKTIKAAKNFKARAIILSGGVAANKHLREGLARKIEKELPQAEFLLPAIKYCTDNAAMIGVAGFFNQNKKTDWQKISAQANLRLK